MKCLNAKNAQTAQTVSYRWTSREPGTRFDEKCRPNTLRGTNDDFGVYFFRRTIRHGKPAKTNTDGDLSAETSRAVDGLCGRVVGPDLTPKRKNNPLGFLRNYNVIAHVISIRGVQNVFKRYLRRYGYCETRVIISGEIKVRGWYCQRFRYNKCRVVERRSRMSRRRDAQTVITIYYLYTNSAHLFHFFSSAYWNRIHTHLYIYICIIYLSWQSTSKGLRQCIRYELCKRNEYDNSVKTKQYAPLNLYIDWVK